MHTMIQKANETFTEDVQRYGWKLTPEKDSTDSLTSS